MQRIHREHLAGLQDKICLSRHCILYPGQDFAVILQVQLAAFDICGRSIRFLNGCVAESNRLIRHVLDHQKDPAYLPVFPICRSPANADCSSHAVDGLTPVQMLLTEPDL